MSKKIYIVFGLISALILIFFITLVTTDSSNGKYSNSSNSNDENSSLEKNYSKKQIKMAKKRNELEVNVDDKMQEYIKNINAPKDQESYDNAIAMRDDENQKRMKRDVKSIVDEKREIKDLTTETTLINSDEIKGDYDYTLIYEKDGKTQSENKDGSYTLDTNEDGYFYIKTFE